MYDNSVYEEIAEEIANETMEDNLSSYINDGILMGKNEIRRDTMDLRFINKSSICAYVVCSDADNVIQSKVKLVNKYVYETKKVATSLSTLVVGNLSLLRCGIDITKCMDLMDIGTYKDLKKYYKYNLKQGNIESEIRDIDLIKSYARDKEFNCVRTIHIHEDTLHPKSKLYGSTIQYYILNESCISSIEKLIDL